MDNCQFLTQSRTCSGNHLIPSPPTLTLLAFISPNSPLLLQLLQLFLDLMNEHLCEGPCPFIPLLPPQVLYITPSPILQPSARFFAKLHPWTLTCTYPTNTPPLPQPVFTFFIFLSFFPFLPLLPFRLLLFLSSLPCLPPLSSPSFFISFSNQLL